MSNQKHLILLKPGIILCPDKRLYANGMGTGPQPEVQAESSRIWNSRVSSNLSLRHFCFGYLKS